MKTILILIIASFTFCIPKVKKCIVTKVSFDESNKIYKITAKYKGKEELIKSKHHYNVNDTILILRNRK